jgi:hypothetical protein
MDAKENENPVGPLSALEPGRNDASNPADASRDSVLPPDIFAVLSDVLALCGLKKTLLELMLASRTAYECGLPCLYRNLELMPRNIDRYATAADDFMGDGKLHHIHTLKVMDCDFAGSTGVLRFVKGAIKYVQRLDVVCRQADFSRTLYMLFSEAINLHTLHIDLVTSEVFAEVSLPPTLRHLRLRAPHRAREGGLVFAYFESVAAKGTMESWELILPGKSIRFLAFSKNYPLLTEKLRVVKCQADEVALLAPFPGIREFRVDAELQNDIDYSLSCIKEHHSELERLVIWGLETWQLPSILASLPSVKELLLLRLEPTLSSQRFDEVVELLRIIGCQKLVIRHATDLAEPDTTELLEGMDPPDIPAEIAYWKSQPGLVWTEGHEAEMRRDWYNTLSDL